MGSIIENLPNALTREFKKNIFHIIDLKNTITKEYAESIIAKISDAVEEIMRFNTPSIGSTGTRYIFLNIHSPGGSWYEACRIIDAIQCAKRHVVVGTIINTIAFSVAVAIFCSGSDGFRFVSPFAEVMIHAPRPKTSPSSRLEIYESDDVHLKRVQEKIEKIILSALDNNPNEEYSKILKQDLVKNRSINWFLDAQDMLDYGITDFIGVPDFLHHVTYQPMLILNNTTIIL